MTREEFARLVEERGGLAGQPVEVDPLIDNPDPIDRKLTPKVPNPNPRRKYIFNNGTQLEATGSGDEVDAQGRPVDVQITDAGTALRPSAGTSLDVTVGAPKDQQFIISRKPDGTLTADQNPNFSGVADEKSTLTPFGNQLLRVNPDGSTTVIATKSEDPKQPTTVPFGDTIYSFDGTKLTPLVTKPKDPTKPVTEVRNGKTFQYDPATNAWSEAAGLPSENKPSTASVNTSARYIVYYDDQGNEVSRNENPNYQPQAPTQLTADTVSPNIPLLKADGTVQWVPNQNRVPASQAMQDLLGQVGVKVNGGDLSMADAKEMLSGTVSVMNAQTAQLNAQTAQQQGGTQAATGALSALGQAAQTGAGILQNRVTNAQGMLSGVLGLAGQGQRSGNMGGGLMNAPAGLGQELVGGIQGWATELGGGQDVYNSAANLVKRADPNNGLGGDAANAYGVLGQMLDKYRQLTGQPHPAEAAVNQSTTAATPTTGGFTAPQQAAGAQNPNNSPFGAIGSNPMLAAMQERNRQLAAQQTAAATQQYGGGPFGAIGSNPLQAAMQQQPFVAPSTAAPGAPKVTVSIG